MSEQVQILLVSSDPTTRDEMRDAVEGLRRLRVALDHVGDLRAAVEMARNRRPELVVAELDRDVETLAGFAEELESVSPESTVVALLPLAGRYVEELLGPGASERDLILRILRTRVRDVLQRPLSSAELQHALDRVVDRPKARKARLGRVASFVSNKGGVGKSTLSVSCAVQLARRHPGQVLLIDASLQHGTCASMLDLEPQATLVDAVREKSRLDETLLQNLSLTHASGLSLLAAPVDAVEAQEVDDGALTRILNLARRTFPFVLVDTFPILDAIVLAVLDLSDVVNVVVPATVPTVQAMARHLQILEGMGVPPARTRLLLNHTHPGFAGELTARDVAQRLERPVDHELPFQRGNLIGLNAGRPYALKAGGWMGFGRALRRLVDDLEQALVAPPEAGPGGARRGAESEEPALPGAGGGLRRTLSAGARRSGPDGREEAELERLLAEEAPPEAELPPARRPGGAP